MRILLWIFFAVAALAPDISAAASSGKVGDYTPVFMPVHPPGSGIKIAVRKFKRGDKTEFLVVDAATFETHITAANPSTAQKAEGSALADTPFIKALARYTARQDGLQNHGLKKAESGTGLFLTVDLCPSKKPLDRGLFIAAVSASGSGAPIAIAVSGEWIAKHRADFDWLIGEIKAGRLSVTWINHTLTHPYDKDKDVEDNFLLMEGVDLGKEVLENEILLIENGIAPTPFFRFPGLVSDNRLLERLRKLSLIPIGANAWLAKGEEPKAGGIILVHGNGNEPEGIKRLLEFYGMEKAGIDGGILRLLPLKDAF